jgi:hypothetical protein
MLKKLLIYAALLAAGPAFGQGVSYVTPVTRNTVPVWNTNGVIAGNVTSADSPVTSFGVTNNGGSGFCVNSARAASPGYNALCFGASTNSPATISLQNYGSASAETLNFVINGVIFPFPGALASITIASTPVLGGTNGNCLDIASGVVNQVPCSILSAGTTGTGSVVLNNSPQLSGTIGGSLTFSGNETFTGNGTFGSALIVNGVSTPASAVGNTVLLGTVSAPVLVNTGQAFLFNTSIGGATLQGDGSTADISLVNKSGNTALQVLTGTTTVSLPGGVTLSGLSSGTCAASVLLNASNQAITGSCPGAAASVQVGTTTVLSGTANNLLYNNAGVLGNGTIASFLTAGTGIAVTGTTNATIALGGTTTAHTLPVWEGSGSNLGNVGPGTLGQAVVSQGSSSDPSYTSGVWSLLTTLTASGSATLNDTTHITSSYNEYKMVMENLVCASNNQTMELQVHTNGAFPSSSYTGSNMTIGSGASVITNPTTFIQISEAAAVQNTGAGLSGEFYFYQPSTTTAPKTVKGMSAHNQGALIATVIFAGAYGGANTAVDGFQVLCASGNIATGNIKIYGML